MNQSVSQTGQVILYIYKLVNVYLKNILSITEVLGLHICFLNFNYFFFKYSTLLAPIYLLEIKFSPKRQLDPVCYHNPPSKLKIQASFLHSSKKWRLVQKKKKNQYKFNTFIDPLSEYKKKHYKWQKTNRFMHMKPNLLTLQTDSDQNKWPNIIVTYLAQTAKSVTNNMVPKIDRGHFDMVCTQMTYSNVRIIDYKY